MTPDPSDRLCSSAQEGGGSAGREVEGDGWNGAELVGDCLPSIRQLRPPQQLESTENLRDS